MPRHKHTDKEIKDFMIRDFVDALRRSMNCMVRFNRNSDDFVEYVKYVEYKMTPDKKIDIQGMIKDYFECEHEHYFEIVRKVDGIRETQKRLEQELDESEG